MKEEERKGETEEGMTEGRRSRILGKADETECGELAKRGKCKGREEGGDRKNLGNRRLVPEDTVGKHQV